MGFRSAGGSCSTARNRRHRRVSRTRPFRGGISNPSN
jgi:hypothetical protein